MGNPFIEFGILIVLLIMNGFFSASELGVVSARKSRLASQAAQGHRGAERVLNLAERPGAFLATVQIGITLIGTISAVFAGGSLTRYLEPMLRPIFSENSSAAASIAVVLLVTFLSLVLGELAPKSIALRNPEGLAARVAPFFQRLSVFARPVVWVLETTTRGLLFVLGMRGEPQEKITEEDVKAIVMQAAESGSLEDGETERIDRVLRFTDRRVREVMTPRGEVTTINLTWPLRDIVVLILDHPHDRYPVVDGQGEVVGQLAVTDVLRASHTGQHIAELMQPVMFLPEMARADDALTRLTGHQHQRLIIVVDEYGEFTGLLTISDLLTELAGVDTPDDLDLIRRRDDGSYLVEASMPLHDLRDTLPLPRFPGESATTLAGYVLEHLGDFPQVGECLSAGDWTLEVLDLDGARIDKVLITPPRDMLLPHDAEP